MTGLSHKTIGLSLGILVIVGTFLSVFGSSLDNLSTEEQPVRINISSLPQGEPPDKSSQIDSMPQVSTQFSIGDEVQVQRIVNVRSTPGTSGAILGAQIIANSGTLIEGPISVDGYQWWKIDYSVSPDGWSVENWLAPEGTVLPVTTQTPPQGGNPLPPQDTTPPAQSGYTLSAIATHNSASSCWSAINGNVYDLTSWVNSHPGGKASILMICGKDGSPLFNAQHAGASRPANFLEDFFIGTLN